MGKKKSSGFGFRKWFNEQSRLVQVLLLLIPGVNWIVEILVRWDKFLQTGALIDLILAIVVIPGIGIILGWIDLFFIIFTNKLFLG